MRTRDPSYLLRIDKATGKTLWRVERHTPARFESPDSYSTPTIAKVDSQEQLIVIGGDVATGHDLKTGEELWRFSLGGDTWSAPISFTLEGHQVIAIAAGRAFFVFELPTD